MPAPVLLASSDEQAVHVVSQVLTELGYAAERPADASAAIREIQSRSFSALVVDCDDLASAKLLFDALRRSKCNQGIPAIAVVSGRTGLPTAFRLGAEFIVTKPASLDQARHTLRTASSKMKKDAGSADPAPAPVASGRASAAAAGASNATSSILNPRGRLLPKTQPAAARPVAPAPAIRSNAAPSAAVSVARPEAVPAPSQRVAPSTGSKGTPAEPAPSLPAKQSFLPRAKSDDPVIADLDDIESPVSFSASPFTQLKLKRRTPVLAFVFVMIALAGAGGYAAFMMRPDFHDFVMYEYVKVRALIGKPVPPPQAPVQPKPAPGQVNQPTVPEVPEAGTPLVTPGTTDGAPASTVVPQSGSSTTTQPATPPQPQPAPASANPQH
jgi:hypothetical protein